MAGCCPYGRGPPTERLLPGGRNTTCASSLVQGDSGGRKQRKKLSGSVQGWSSEGKDYTRACSKRIKSSSRYILNTINIINRPGVAVAVLQTPP